MARKRANGDGSVTFDKTAGMWVARVTVGYRSDGRAIRKKFTAKTQREANDRMKAALKATGQGLEPPDEKLTTGQWLAKWLDTLSDGAVTRGTEDTYRRAVRLWVDPAVGHIPLQKLRPDDVSTMLRRLADQGLSGETQRMARAVLRRALRRAEQHGLLGRNVAALADGPRIARAERRAMTSEQARVLLGAAEGDRLGAAILVELAVGLRGRADR